MRGPGSSREGKLSEELRDGLDGYVILGARTVAPRPALTPGERTALVAAALAAAMPTTVLNSIGRDLPALAEALAEAVAAGRAAAGT
ncbi:hypothetical protein ACIGXM_32020 [Kitasatospora sp. NPDC052896]|uniref:hypothetical protein n=1 Tax=Kitasatospora sp. NPDC052896 TaxID=3364061 RepID=UPI0037CABF4A